MDAYDNEHSLSYQILKLWHIYHKYIWKSWSMKKLNDKESESHAPNIEEGVEHTQFRAWILILIVDSYQVFCPQRISI